MKYSLTTLDFNNQEDFRLENVAIIKVYPDWVQSGGIAVMMDDTTGKTGKVEIKVVGTKAYITFLDEIK
jgi:hypothetical protein